MEVCYQSFEIIEAMANIGNPNSVTDAGVGALCARTAVLGAGMNVRINTGDLEDKEYVAKVLSRVEELSKLANEAEKRITDVVSSKI